MKNIKNILINFKFKIKNILVLTSNFFKKRKIEKKEIFFLLFFIYLLWYTNKKPPIITIPNAWEKFLDKCSGFFSFFMNSISSFNIFSTLSNAFLNSLNRIRSWLDFLLPFLSFPGQLFFYGFLVFCFFFFLYNAWTKRRSIFEFVKILTERVVNSILKLSNSLYLKIINFVDNNIRILVTGFITTIYWIVENLQITELLELSELESPQSEPEVVIDFSQVERDSSVQRASELLLLNDTPPTQIEIQQVQPLISDENQEADLPPLSDLELRVLDLERADLQRRIDALRSSIPPINKPDNSLWEKWIKIREKDTILKGMVNKEISQSQVIFNSQSETCQESINLIEQSSHDIGQPLIDVVWTTPLILSLSIFLVGVFSYYYYKKKKNNKS